MFKETKEELAKGEPAIFLSYDRIARRCSKGVRTIKDIIPGLILKGVLRKKSPRGGKWGTQSTLWAPGDRLAWIPYRKDGSGDFDKLVEIGNKIAEQSAVNRTMTTPPQSAEFDTSKVRDEARAKCDMEHEQSAAHRTPEERREKITIESGEEERVAGVFAPLSSSQSPTQKPTSEKAEAQSEMSCPGGPDASLKEDPLWDDGSDDDDDDAADRAFQVVLPRPDLHQL